MIRKESRDLPNITKNLKIEIIMLKKGKELEKASLEFAKSTNDTTDIAIRINALMYREGYNAAVKDIDGTTSDGYHTFDELYYYRMLYNAAFVNSCKDSTVNCCKSKRHHNGELCFGGGWFIVFMELPDVGQVTNHYENKYWDLFNCKEVETAPEWDGHSSQVAAERLLDYIKTCQE